MYSKLWVIYIYIDEINEFLGRCYHQVRVELFGQPKSTDAFFVSVEGHQLITNGRGIPLRMWDKITNYPGSTSYLFRDMFTNHVYDSKSGKLANIISIFLSLLMLFSSHIARL